MRDRHHEMQTDKKETIIKMKMIQKCKEFKLNDYRNRLRQEETSFIGLNKRTLCRLGESGRLGFLKTSLFVRLQSSNSFALKDTYNINT